MQNAFVFPFCIKNMKIRIHKIIMLPLILYGCETWSVILREEYGVKKFKKSAEKHICA